MAANQNVSYIPLIGSSDTPTTNTPIAGCAAVQVNANLSLAITGADGTTVTPFAPSGTATGDVTITSQNGEFVIVLLNDVGLNLQPNCRYLVSATFNFTNFAAATVGFTQIEVPQFLADTPTTTRVFLSNVDTSAGGWDPRAGVNFFIEIGASVPAQGLKLCLIDMTVDNTGDLVPFVVSAMRI